MGVSAEANDPETVFENTQPTATTFANPFASAVANPNQAGGQNQGTNESGYRNDTGTGAGRGDRGGFDVPVGALKRSQLGVINGINQRANEILLSYKSISNDIVQLVQRQAQLMERMQTSSMIDEGMASDVNEVCNMLMEFSSSTIRKMEEACAFIEGDTGIYVKETMPVAPLLRREDGSIMK
ncbi:hypothetical protein FVEG_15995 [Fusarium verticillioides 7600]|uniref:Uncharacterized protein n=1 Tax=Gibberella moniliformis (strain M3125 / FGSC 7600) TaxID=334819 RepID=W7MPL4_GIBM7|nr:hypothetical protein FVEG_15995 [Fusarium verticillioides 7600]EWG46572.1 hypothetical protein FVEG_15995 [Fusarium verticillioides 7600]